MKILGLVLLSILLLVNLQAGKVDWTEDGRAIIAGSAGQGCTQSGFGTEDKNTTKPNCS